jgi:hypothetical protein
MAALGRRRDLERKAQNAVDRVSSDEAGVWVSVVWEQFLGLVE